jgi:hypothetical protein
MLIHKKPPESVSSPSKLDEHIVRFKEHVLSYCRHLRFVLAPVQTPVNKAFDTVFRHCATATTELGIFIHYSKILNPGSLLGQD